MWAVREAEGLNGNYTFAVEAKSGNIEPENAALAYLQWVCAY